MTEQLVQNFGRQIESVTLKPSRGGRFEVTMDGVLVYSKAETGQHANADALIEEARRRLDSRT